jgi:DNA-directed RNA polymerase specialized sigma24 family protein
MSADNPHELEEFCSRWKKDVFAFCRVLLGDGAAAEEAACDVFAAFYREREPRMSQEIPPRLLGLALRATEKYRNGSSQSLQSGSRLESAILRLPRLERAVVTMRNLLHMEWAALALAADLSRVEAHQVWMRGIFQLNDLLQKELPKERH